MRLSSCLFLIFALFAAGYGGDGFAGKRTVCTITVNSSDEKEMFRQRLPADQYELVELVERGRPDWLASACRQGVRCDLLVISGHFDGSTEFYSDQVAASEFLPVAEMERASCSDSCPGLFSQLKEVYLFGCNTLSADAIKFASSEVGRSLVRAGYKPEDARRLARTLDQLHGESSRDRMRRIFTNVPVIYGFSSVAPLGPTAAHLLGRYLHPPSIAEVGNGRASPRLLGHFASESMIATSGLTDSDPRAVHRREVCKFIDDRLSPADKLTFIHGLLRRDMVEVRMFLERIEGLFASLSEADRTTPAFAQALDAIARDDVARERYLRFAERADLPRIRARMIRLAGTLGWLSPQDQRTELLRMVDDLLRRDAVGAADVDMVCSLNKDHELDGERHRLTLSPANAGIVPNAAVLACLGSAEDRARVLQALTDGDDGEVQIAEVYLGHRPITDVGELRVVANGITRMTGSPAQVRALDTLARHRLSDAQSLDELTRLFPVSQSVDVQRAIAAVFIRADLQQLRKPEMVRVLSQNRLKSPAGDDIIDILIRRLQTP
ncbi:MAG: hypothetical protein ABWZ29_00590 [Casimicrobiaceae bacterium]